MKLTRRRFLESTGAIVAAGGLVRSPAAAAQPQSSRPVTGAPGVELNFDAAGLPDYSRDLERYLVRLAGRGARAAEADRGCDRHATGRCRQAEGDCFGAVEDARRPAPENAAQCARHGNVRSARLPDREAVVREPEAAVRHGESLRAVRARDAARRFSRRSGIRRTARRGPATRSCSRTSRARATSSLPTTRSDRGSASSTRKSSWRVHDSRRWNRRARVRRPSAHPARRELRAVPRVGRHPRNRLSGHARGGRSRADWLLRPVWRRDADAVPGGARQPDPRGRRVRGKHRESRAGERRAAGVGGRCGAEHRAGARARDRSGGPALRVRAEAAPDRDHAARRRTHLFAGVRVRLAAILSTNTSARTACWAPATAWRCRRRPCGTGTSTRCAGRLTGGSTAGSR